MARKRPLKERAIDYALLGVSLGVMVFSLFVMAEIIATQFFFVPFVEFFLLFLLGIFGIRLWRKETS